MTYLVEEWHGEAWSRQLFECASGLTAFHTARRHAVDKQVEVRVLSTDNRTAYRINSSGEMLPYILTTKPVDNDYLAALAKDPDARP